MRKVEIDIEDILSTFIYLDDSNQGSSGIYYHLGQWIGELSDAEICEYACSQYEWLDEGYSHCVDQLTRFRDTYVRQPN